MQTQIYTSLSAHLPEEHTHACMHASPACLPPQSSPLAPPCPASPSSCSVCRAPPLLTVPPIWLEQWVQAGQPSRSLSKAAEYSSSLGVSPPTLCPGLGPFNKRQVIQMEGEGGQTPRWLVGGEYKCFFPPSYSYSVFLCVGSLPLSTCCIFSVSCFDTVGRRPGRRWLQVLRLVWLVCHLLLNTTCRVPIHFHGHNF